MSLFCKNCQYCIGLLLNQVTDLDPQSLNVCTHPGDYHWIGPIGQQQNADIKSNYFATIQIYFELTVFWGFHLTL